MSARTGRVECFVIGAMKAGTTAMCTWLDAQDGIAVSEPKEPAVFATADSSAAWADRVATFYQSADDADLWVDGSTDYAKSPHVDGVPQRVTAGHPDARYVYMMRDPIARAISQYRFEWMLGGDKLPFDRAVSENSALVDYSRYAFQLTRWLEVVEPAKILLVFAEEFDRDPSTQVGRVLRFLGHDDVVETPQRRRDNQTDQLVRPTLARKVLRESALGRALRPLAPESVTRAYKRRVTASSRPDVSDTTRAHLADVFDADLRDLTAMTGGPGITCASWHATTTTWTPQLRSS